MSTFNQIKPQKVSFFHSVLPLGGQQKQQHITYHDLHLLKLRNYQFPWVIMSPFWSMPQAFTSRCPTPVCLKSGMISWYALTPCSLASHSARGGSFVGFWPNPSRRVAIGPFHWSNYWPPCVLHAKECEQRHDKPGPGFEIWNVKKQTYNRKIHKLISVLFGSHHISWYVNN